MVDFLNFTNIESIIPVLTPFWIVIKNWWWLVLPFILLPSLQSFYLWFIRSKWDSTIDKILLEVKIPKEVERPISKNPVVVFIIKVVPSHCKDASFPNP